MTETSEKPTTITVTEQIERTLPFSDAAAWNKRVLDVAEQLREKVAATGRAWNEGTTAAEVRDEPDSPVLELVMDWVPRRVVKGTDCLHHAGPVHEHCGGCGLPVWPEDEDEHVCPPGFDL